MRGTLFRKIRIADCMQERQCDLLVQDGSIKAIGTDLPAGDCRVMEGAGLTLMPSFVDLHAHFRDPGLTHKEDIHSGCRAAVHGGYTAVNLMANTKPVCSSMEGVRYVRNKAAELDLLDVHQVVSITRDFDGVSLSHLDELDGTVKWLSDDGVGVADTGVMLQAMNKAKEKGIGLMLHEEDAALTKIDSYLMEELMTFRDVKLAALTGCKTHFCHVSTIQAMEHILAAKAEHSNITLEVSPHHLALNDNNGGKVAPPLRREEHRQFLVDCVRRGLVDAIATDHAPHTPEEKKAGANGFTGLDLSFATCYTALVREGHIPITALSSLMSRGPARLLGLDVGLLEEGRPANLVLVDLGTSFLVDESRIHSRSKNSPLMGQTLWGEVLMTMRNGRIVYEKAD